MFAATTSAQITFCFFVGQYFSFNMRFLRYSTQLYDAILKFSPEYTILSIILSRDPSSETGVKLQKIFKNTLGHSFLRISYQYLKILMNPFLLKCLPMNFQRIFFLYKINTFHYYFNIIFLIKCLKFIGNASYL